MSFDKVLSVVSLLVSHPLDAYTQTILIEYMHKHVNILVSQAFHTNIRYKLRKFKKANTLSWNDANCIYNLMVRETAKHKSEFFRLVYDGCINMYNIVVQLLGVDSIKRICKHWRGYNGRKDLFIESVMDYLPELVALYPEFSRDVSSYLRDRIKEHSSLLSRYKSALLVDESLSEMMNKCIIDDTTGTGPSSTGNGPSSRYTISTTVSSTSSDGSS